MRLPGLNTTALICDSRRRQARSSIAHTIYVVGAAEDGRSGKVEWTLVMPGHLSAIAIADVEGDGLAQIVVSSADGVVYGIDSAKKQRKK